MFRKLFLITLIVLFILSCGKSDNWSILLSNVVIKSEGEYYLTDIYVSSESNIKSKPSKNEFYDLLYQYMWRNNINNAFTLQMNSDYLKNLSKICNTTIDKFAIIVKKDTTIDMNADYRNIELHIKNHDKTNADHTQGTRKSKE